jgi:hypothetical protein
MERSRTHLSDKLNTLKYEKVFFFNFWNDFFCLCVFMDVPFAKT